jgi:ribosome-binding protein aMBF1 (putative translation factor)
MAPDPTTQATPIDTQDTMVRLEEFAQISLYRTNAFQILQLPVWSSAREINKRQQMAEIASRTGAPLSHGPGCYVALRNTVEASEIGKIVRDIQDPLTRLFHEFFWIWVNSTDSPPKNLSGLAGLTRQIEYWKLKEESDETGYAIHNLAVLTHAAALELEQYMIAKGSKPELALQAKDFWGATYTYWHNVQENDKFWDLVIARIREIDDPQLTTGIARRLRAALPGFLLCLHARLFIQLIEQNRENDAWRHINLIEASNINLKSVENTIGRLLEPIRDRVKSFCEASRSQFETDGIHADKSVELLIKQCSNQMKIIEALLPQGSIIKKVVFEEYTDTCLDGAEAYYRKTDDYQSTLSLLVKIKMQGMSQKELARINEFTNQVIEESKKGNYWHSAGYFNLPERILTLLETAYDHCQQGRLGKAQKILVQLFEQEYSSGGTAAQCISTALSFCMNLLGLQLLDAGYQLAQRERTSVINIRNRARNPSPGFNITANAIINNTVDYWGRRWMIECMACGRTISGGYYIIQISNTKAIICSECQKIDQTERERRRSEIKEKLVAAQNHFYTSGQLNQSNKIAESNLATVLNIMRDMEFDIPRSRMVVEFPSGTKPTTLGQSTRHTSATPSSRTTHTTRKDTSKDKTVTIAWVIFLAFICLVVFLAGANNPPENGSNYAAPTRYITRVVTSVPTIVSSPTLHRPTVTIMPTPVQISACSTVKLNVRQGPGTEYPVIAGIAPDDCVVVIGRISDGSFLQIETIFGGENVKGWAASQFLILEGNFTLDDIPIIASP